MKTGSAGINATLADEVGTLARLWTIEPANGDPIRFTDCDDEVVFEGNTYSNEIGFSASSIVSAANSLAQGCDILTVIGTDITEDRIRSSYFDKATVHLVVVDYETPTNGGIKLFGGTVGQIEYDDLGKVTIHVVGLFSNKVFINIETYGNFCRAEFGDARCQFDIESLRAEFTVAAQINGQKFTTVELNEDDGYWRYGILKFTSGFNNGVVITVATSKSADKSIILFVPAPFTITAGDTGTIYPGCDKTLAMCRDRYDNIIHFRGEPYTPKLAPNL